MARSPSEVAADLSKLLPRPRSFQTDLYVFNLSVSEAGQERECAEYLLETSDLRDWSGPESDALRDELRAFAAGPRPER